MCYRPSRRPRLPSYLEAALANLERRDNERLAQQLRQNRQAERDQRITALDREYPSQTFKEWRRGFKAQRKQARKSRESQQEPKGTGCFSGIFRARAMGQKDVEMQYMEPELPDTW
jgi:hypothetical protein